MRDVKWFADCGWGVFCHYLAAPASCGDEPDLTADEWNRQIDDFDVAGLAQQLKSVHTRYFFITIGQGSGYYCAPNETYDRIAGVNPSKCSQRDLVSDLYDDLQPLGIELLVYAPADGSWADPEARAGLKQIRHWSDPNPHPYNTDEFWSEYRLPEFQSNWEEICRDWAMRWGNKVRGWWIDGAYAAHIRYPENEEPNFKSYAEALRAGNPDALIAFNPGVLVPVIHYTDHEDFTAGEISDALPECPGQFVTADSGHKDLYHILSYLGSFWGRGEPRFPDEMVSGYTRHITSKGGVITWDVPISKSGLIPEEHINQLKAIGEYIIQSKRI